MKYIFHRKLNCLKRRTRKTGKTINKYKKEEKEQVKPREKVINELKNKYLIVQFPKIILYYIQIYFITKEVVAISVYYLEQICYFFLVECENQNSVEYEIC